MTNADDPTARRRGPGQAPVWRWDGPVSVLRLPLDVHDPALRRHVERVFATAFAVRRAVQRDARARLTAFATARQLRTAVDPAVARDRLGLTRAGLEQAAYRHLDRAAHLRRYLTKALAMHGADVVWQALEHHLFPDAAGRRRERAAALSRRGGVDVNVSNLAIVSVPAADAGDALRVTRIAATGEDVERLTAERLRQRRSRALQRSRRASNPGQYRLSDGQQRRADRRLAAGLPPVQVPVPRGPRIATVAGAPVQAYRHDRTSATYRQLRAAIAADGEARTHARTADSSATATSSPPSSAPTPPWPSRVCPARPGSTGPLPAPRSPRTAWHPSATGCKEP
ncbi:hypothetical protein KZZ52_50905 [Dactylosporangium sp. AC04546]|uniref:hypothetical protein n=1 Tax=Dactylosporangium sp. AC04546 TaxID=2862460 RepID=UPI001EDC9AE4|nr:hypothetical protein [Dactylosporangium sp. AC04546]WVK82182.1 hypothetical protein KZZ52_50905 [Dactylosporangium sp. AC04546]